MPLLALLKHPLVGGEGEERLALARRRCARSTSRCAARARRRASPGLDAAFRDEPSSVAWAKRAAAGRGGRRRCSRGRSPLAELARRIADCRDIAGRRSRVARRRRTPGGRTARRAAKRRRGAEAMVIARRRRGAGASPAARAAARSPALWRTPADLHLGPARSAAAAGRSDGARRAQRGRLAGPARARSVACAEDPRQSRPAGPRLSGSALSAHDFASALGAPQVLITRARRDARSPTVASRFWLRLQAMTGGVTRDTRARTAGRRARRSRRAAAGRAARARRRRASFGRDKISVTQVDRLKADPFAFYAQAMLGLRTLDAGRRRP